MVYSTDILIDTYCVGIHICGHLILIVELDNGRWKHHTIVFFARTHILT